MKKLLVAFLFLISWSAFPQGAPPPKGSGGTVAIATQAEALAGVNDSKAMSPLKVKDVVKALTDTALANRARITQVNSLSSAISGKENSSNKKTTGTLGSSTSQFPVEKIIKDYIDGIAAQKVNTSALGTIAGKNEAASVTDTLPSKVPNFQQVNRLYYYLLSVLPLDGELYADADWFKGNLFNSGDKFRLDTVKLADFIAKNAPAPVQPLAPYSEAVRMLRAGGSPIKYENFAHHLLFQGSSNVPLVSGTVYYSLIEVLRPDTLTGVGFYPRVKGDFQAAGLENRISFFEVNRATGEFTQIAQSDTSASIWKGVVNQWKQVAFQSPVIVEPGFYVVAYLYNSTPGTEVTQPAIYSLTSSSSPSNTVAGSSHIIPPFMISKDATNATMPTTSTTADRNPSERKFYTSTY